MTGASSWEGRTLASRAWGSRGLLMAGQSWHQGSLLAQDTWTMACSPDGLLPLASTSTGPPCTGLGWGPWAGCSLLLRSLRQLPVLAPLSPRPG